ncbi:MAG: glucose-1-phosphate thymidylyltransferase [bacterium]
MKALVLAGGKGSRLRPITHTSAKQLIPVANKPILFYGIEAIKEAGITDIGFIIGDNGNEIISAVGDGSRWGIKATFIEQEAPLGLAHAVKIAEDYIAEEPFLMFLGDNLLKNGIKSVVDDFKSNSPNAQILLAKVKNAQDFGVAELSGKKVVKLVEKPKKPKSDLALVGVYLFDKNIFKAVNSIKPSKRGELEITDAIQYLIDNKYKVDSYKVDGWWKDTGKLEDIIEANRLFLDTVNPLIKGEVDDASRIEGKVIVELGACIKGSHIRGPAVIGEGCIIIDSYIGPFTSLYRNIKIEGSELENSIVLQDSSIRDIKRIEGSLIGQNVRISKNVQKPAAYRIMVGDSSQVEVL